MKRFAYNQLIQWKNNNNQNFLLLGGISCVGKTTLALDFAKNEYSNFKYFNQPEKINEIKNHLETNNDISLIIIDNLFGNKNYLVKYKEISERYINCDFIVIDSFAKEGRGDSTTIALQYLVIYPLSFDEFLFNTSEDTYIKLASLENINSIDNNFNELLNNYLNHYLFVGGMPSVVEIYKKAGLDYLEIRNEQNVILLKILENLKKFYKTTDFKNLLKIWDLIYLTLIRDNKKFKLSDISSSTRYNAFKKYFYILKRLNLINISSQVKGGEFDIDEKSNIIYFCDVGLLGSLGQVPISLYNKNILFQNQITNGIILNFVSCELISTSNTPFYYWVHNMSKIEFLLKAKDYYLPLEVKNDSSGKLKSLGSFNHFHPDIKLSRFNFLKPQIKGNINCYPLYLVKSLYRKIIN